jgi:hypothetical protein
LRDRLCNGCQSRAKHLCIGAAGIQHRAHRIHIHLIAKEYLDQKRLPRGFDRVRLPQPFIQHRPPGIGQVMQAAVRPRLLGQFLDRDEGISDKHLQSAVNLRLIRLPEMGDRLVKRLAQIIARHRLDREKPKNRNTQ